MAAVSSYFLDAHLHARQGEMLRTVLPFTIAKSVGAVFMPNTDPPITTPDQALAYREMIMKTAQEYAVEGKGFDPIMVGYLTEDTDPDDVELGLTMGAWDALKFYPRSKKHGAGTTNAHNGVSDLRLCEAVLARMEEIGVPILLHGERLDEVDTGEETDPYDREQLFIEHDLTWLRAQFPKLRIVLEHITTEAAARFMALNGHPNNMCATVTAHHAVLDRRDVFRGGMNPAYHCMPVVKRTRHRTAIRQLIAAGHPFVFAGTDSAPHPLHAKERACGCAAGVFTAHCAPELYAEIYDDVTGGKLEEHVPAFRGFMAENAARFYGISLSGRMLQFEKYPWQQHEVLAKGTGIVVFPFGYHEKVDQRRTFKYQAVLA